MRSPRSIRHVVYSLDFIHSVSMLGGLPPLISLFAGRIGQSPAGAEEIVYSLLIHSSLKVHAECRKWGGTDLVPLHVNFAMGTRTGDSTDQIVREGDTRPLADLGITTTHDI